MRAKKDLGAKSHKWFRQDTAEWYWFDQSVPWPKDAPFAKPTPFDMPEFDLWD